MPRLATPLSLPRGGVLGVPGVGSVPTGGKSLCQGESPQPAALLCTWCLPSSRGGREWVWIHQGGSCDLPGIPYTGQPDWRFNCVLRRVPMGYTCTIKMFPGPKGKWQSMAHIWIEEIPVPKQAAVKSPWLCCPLGHARVENRSKYLWKFYKLQSVYNSKPMLEPFSLLI